MKAEETQRETCKRLFEESGLDRQPVHWHTWKRAFDLGVMHGINAQKEPQSNEVTDSEIETVKGCYKTGEECKHNCGRLCRDS